MLQARQAATQLANAMVPPYRRGKIWSMVAEASKSPSISITPEQ